MRRRRIAVTSSFFNGVPHMVRTLRVVDDGVGFRIIAAQKIGAFFFSRSNARTEPHGTLLRDNEDEKRYSVSG